MAGLTIYIDDKDLKKYQNAGETDLDKSISNMYNAKKFIDEYYQSEGFENRVKKENEALTRHGIGYNINQNSIIASDYDLHSADQLRNQYQSFNSNGQITIGIKNNPNSNGTAHEIGHSSKFWNTPLNGTSNKEDIKYSPYYHNDYRNTGSWKFILEPNNKAKTSHDRDLSESYSDLLELRYWLQKNGYFDNNNPNDVMTKERMYDILKNNGVIFDNNNKYKGYDNRAYQIPFSVRRFLINHEPEQIIDALNLVAENNTNELDKAQKGYSWTDAQNTTPNETKPQGKYNVVATDNAYMTTQQPKSFQEVVVNEPVYDKVAKAIFPAEPSNGIVRDANGNLLGEMPIESLRGFKDPVFNVAFLGAGLANGAMKGITSIGEKVVTNKPLWTAISANNIKNRIEDEGFVEGVFGHPVQTTFDLLMLGPAAKAIKTVGNEAMWKYMPQIPMSMMLNKGIRNTTLQQEVAHIPYKNISAINEEALKLPTTEMPSFTTLKDMQSQQNYLSKIEDLYKQHLQSGNISEAYLKSLNDEYVKTLTDNHFKKMYHYTQNGFDNFKQFEPQLLSEPMFHFGTENTVKFIDTKNKLLRSGIKMPVSIPDKNKFIISNLEPNTNNNTTKEFYIRTFNPQKMNDKIHWDSRVFDDMPSDIKYEHEKLSRFNSNKGYINEEINDILKEYGQKELTKSELSNLDDKTYEKIQYFLRKKESDNIKKYFRSKGYDSVEYINEFEFPGEISLATPYNFNIKEATPIKLDAKGNIMLPSQRFDFTNPEYEQGGDLHPSIEEYKSGGVQQKQSGGELDKAQYGTQTKINIIDDVNEHKFRKLYDSDNKSLYTGFTGRRGESTNGEVYLANGMSNAEIRKEFPNALIKVENGVKTFRLPRVNEEVVLPKVESKWNTVITLPNGQEERQMMALVPVNNKVTKTPTYKVTEHGITNMLDFDSPWTLPRWTMAFEDNAGKMYANRYNELMNEYYDNGGKDNPMEYILNKDFDEVQTTGEFETIFNTPNSLIWDTTKNSFVIVDSNGRPHYSYDYDWSNGWHSTSDNYKVYKPKQNKITTIDHNAVKRNKFIKEMNDVNRIANMLNAGQNRTWNLQYQQGGPTHLQPWDEQRFRIWFNSLPEGIRNSNDYDYRGWWLENGSIPYKQILSGNGHFTDKYKLPNHPTFSNQSIYSKGNTIGGQWINNDMDFVPSQYNVRNGSDRIVDYMEFGDKGSRMFDTNGMVAQFKDGGPTGLTIVIDDEQFKKGGQIHIKEKNKGKFTKQAQSA